MKKSLGIAAALIAVFSTGAAHAQSAPPWYVGASIGSSKSNVNAGEVNGFLRSLGYGSPATSADDKDQAYKFLVGYRFSPVISVEGFYADLGKYNSRTTVTTPFPGTVSADYKAKGYGEIGRAHV